MAEQLICNQQVASSILVVGSISNNKRRYKTMTHTISMYEARINLLEQRDPVANANIVRKLKRKIRRLEK